MKDWYIKKRYNTKTVHQIYVVSDSDLRMQATCKYTDTRLNIESDNFKWQLLKTRYACHTLQKAFAVRFSFFSS